MSNDDDRIEYLTGSPDAEIHDAAERVELDAMRELLASPELWEEPPAGLEDSVVAAVVDAQRAAESPRSGAPAASVTDLGVERARRRTWLSAGAAAAAVVALVAIGSLVIGRSDSPDTFAFTVEATAAAPSAAGSVSASKTDSGWRIDLDIEGLERLDDGEFYEAWLKNADGILVPIGTFNEGTDVVLWAGVPIIEYSTLTVTRELTDGDQSSSGELVVSATLDE